MYSNFEFVEDSVSDCSKCGKDNAPTHYLPVFLYRWDCYPKLSIDPAYLSDEKMDCPDCCNTIGLTGHFHWTELRAVCWECESGKMLFSELIDGIKMGEFINIAIEESKLKAPEIGYTCSVNGHEYYVGSAHDLYIEELADQKQVVKTNNWEFKFSAT